jgi:lipopolysaccharide export LptBFGC system permease protein LptF
MKQVVLEQFFGARRARLALAAPARYAARRMRLLDRYLLRELFAMLGLCLCGLLLVYVAFDLISELNRFQEAHLQVRDVAELYLVKVPDILVFILPITILIALLYVVTNHARHHELTAMRAAGISLGRICVPYLAVGFLLSLTVFAMNEYWVPDSEARQNEIMNRRRDIPADEVNVQKKLSLINLRDSRNWVMDAYHLDTGVMINPKVDWREDGANWSLLAKRAEWINGVWIFFGSTTFATNDLTNLEALAGKLKRPPAGDSVSPFLRARLSPATQTLLANYSGGANAELQRGLVEDLNKIVRGGALYEPDRFASVKLSPEIAGQVARHPEGTELIEINRALLMEAYPEISRNSLYTLDVWKSDANPKLPPHHVISTNLLAMPQFTETPNVFASQARFSSKLSSINADAAELPIREIREYLRLHPDDLSRKDRMWLQTQMQGRFATPWSCLVAVLIAIPFGAPSGRRNIFVGVASAIVICFGYFILLRLGLALGTGGILPPVLAAWLPNAVFGITAFAMMLRVR